MKLLNHSLIPVTGPTIRDFSWFCGCMSIGSLCFRRGLGFTLSVGLSVSLKKHVGFGDNRVVTGTEHLADPTAHCTGIILGACRQIFTLNRILQGVSGGCVPDICTQKGLRQAQHQTLQLGLANGLRVQGA